MIAIKGVEMPRCCWYCPLTYKVIELGRYYCRAGLIIAEKPDEAIIDLRIMKEKRMSFCPLIEVEVK